MCPIPKKHLAKEKCLVIRKINVSIFVVWTHMSDYLGVVLLWEMVISNLSTKEDITVII